MRSNSRCARRVHWRRVERRVELIIGRSARIAALLPALLSPPGTRRKGKKGEEGRQYGLKGGRISPRVEHRVDLCQMVDSVVALLCLGATLAENTERVTTFGIYLSDAPPVIPGTAKAKARGGEATKGKRP